MADAPDLLCTRIALLTNYIVDPTLQLEQYLYASKDNGDDDDDSSKEEEELDDIVWMLSDLEYQLMDIDMAREFHTMGGLPLLISLLTDSIHGILPNTQNTLRNHPQRGTKTAANNKNNTMTTIMMIKNEEDRRQLRTLV